MSNDSRFVSESLEALLVSIADGVREAQDALSDVPPLDAYGRPMPSYHLPHLDFEVKVDMETVTTGGGLMLLRLNPLGGGGSNTTRDISSTISGRLVAIPPGEGLPVPLLVISSVRETARRHRIQITAMNSAGEILAGEGIELNINMDASRKLSSAEGVTLTNKRAGTKLSDVLLTTNAEGVAETTFFVDAGLSAKTILVLTAELGTAVAHLTIQAGGGS